MRVFLIGAGVISAEHAKAALKLPGGAELHFADVRAEAAAARAKEFPGAVAHENVASMLEMEAEEDDIVIVATPVFAHFESAVAALKSGRHVLCEKPLGLGTKEAIAMLRVARLEGRHIGCCSARFLGTELALKLRQRLATKELGDLYHITWRFRSRRSRTGIDYQPQAPWFVDRSRSGGGVLMDWSPYDISLLSEILSPKEVEIRAAWVATPVAHAANHPTVVDVEFHAGAHMVWRTPYGAVPLSFERASCTYGPVGSSFSFEGTRGAGEYQWLNWDKPNRLSFASENADGSAREEALDEPMGDVHDRPLHGFVELLGGRVSERTPVVADEKAVFNFSIIRGIYDVAKSGKPLTVRLEDIERKVRS